MPIVYSIDSTTRSLRVRYSGAIVTGDVLRFFDGFEPRISQFSDFVEHVDFKRVTRVSISAGELHCLYCLLHGIYLRNAPRKDILVHAPTPAARGAVRGFAEFFSQQKVAPDVKFV